MKYDVKIFEQEEQETIRNVRWHQLIAIAAVLRRHSIQHLVKDDEGQYWTWSGDRLVALKECPYGLDFGKSILAAEEDPHACPRSDCKTKHPKIYRACELSAYPIPRARVRRRT